MAEIVLKDKELNTSFTTTSPKRKQKSPRTCCPSGKITILGLLLRISTSRLRNEIIAGSQKSFRVSVGYSCTILKYY